MMEELWQQATPVGFEPTRGDPIGLAGRRLGHSAKVSLVRANRENVSSGQTSVSLMRWTAECMGVLELLVDHSGSAALHAGAGGLRAWALAGQRWRQPMRSGEMGHLTR